MACTLHQWLKNDAGEWVCAVCGALFGDAPAPRAETKSARLGKRQRLVLRVLEDGEWHDGHELTHPAVGGSEGLRRLRELREKGYTIEMRKKAKGQTTRQYRLEGS